jgi:hypothetical protein
MEYRKKPVEMKDEVVFTGADFAFSLEEGTLTIQLKGVVKPLVPVSAVALLVEQE